MPMKKLALYVPSVMQWQPVFSFVTLSPICSLHRWCDQLLIVTQEAEGDRSTASLWQLQVDILERKRPSKKQKDKKGKGRSWVLKKKEQRRHRGYTNVPQDTKYTGRKRKSQFQQVGLDQNPVLLIFYCMVFICIDPTPHTSMPPSYGCLVRPLLHMTLEIA